MQKLGTKALNREPTQKMVDEVRNYLVKKYSLGISETAVKACWEVMWDTAIHQGYDK